MYPPEIYPRHFVWTTGMHLVKAGHVTAVACSRLCDWNLISVVIPSIVYCLYAQIMKHKDRESRRHQSNQPTEENTLVFVSIVFAQRSPTMEVERPSGCWHVGHLGWGRSLVVARQGATRPPTVCVNSLTSSSTGTCNSMPPCAVQYPHRQIMIGIPIPSFTLYN